MEENNSKAKHEIEIVSPQTGRRALTRQWHISGLLLKFAGLALPELSASRSRNLWEITKLYAKLHESVLVTDSYVPFRN